MPGFSEKLSAIKEKQEAAEQKKKEEADKAAEATKLGREAKRSELTAERDRVMLEFAQAEAAANDAQKAIAEADIYVAEQGENLDPEARTEIDIVKAEALEAQQRFEEVKTKLDGLNAEISAFEESGGSQVNSTEATAEVSLSSVENTANSAMEEKAFTEMFSEETAQLETLKNSVESANTIEDLEATLKTAQSLRELTRNKLQGVQTGKGLSGKPDSLNRLISASRLNEMDELVDTIRAKWGAEAEKATETFLVELNNEYNAFTKNIEQVLASVPETGSLEGLSLKELSGKLNELNNYQRKLDSMKSETSLDAVRAITDKENKFNAKMKSWEERSNNRFDLWRKVDRGGAERKALDAQISLNEKAPTLATPRVEAVKQAIDKFFSKYGTKIDTIATEYQKNKAIIETEEKGINDQITQLEARKGIFNKGKNEKQIVELRKGLGKLDALRDQTRSQLQALKGEMDRLNDETRDVYKDKFSLLEKKRVQVWNNL